MTKAIAAKVHGTNSRFVRNLKMVKQLNKYPLKWPPIIPVWKLR